MTVAPAVSGLHHVTFVVSDLDSGIDWFSRVLGVTHIPRFDHHDESGARYGVILQLAGFPGMLELRLADAGYPLRADYDPVTFEVASAQSLEAWAAHLDDAGVARSAIKQRRTGQSLEFCTPDGTLLRLFTAPEGGFDAVTFQEEHVDR